MKLSKIKLLSKSKVEFEKWANGLTNRKHSPLSEEMQADFNNSWPVVANTNDVLRGAFVVHWLLVHKNRIIDVSLPIVMGSLTYMQLAAISIGRPELAEATQALLQNFTRINQMILNTTESNDNTQEE